MFSTLKSFFNAGAIFSGHGVQVKLGLNDSRIGVLEMIHPPTQEDPDTLVLDFVWLAKHSFPDRLLSEGERGKEIKLSILDLQYEKRISHSGEFRGVTIKNGDIQVRFFPSKWDFRPRESRVISWVN